MDYALLSIPCREFKLSQELGPSSHLLTPLYQMEWERASEREKKTLWVEIRTV